MISIQIETARRSELGSGIPKAPIVKTASTWYRPGGALNGSSAHIV
jgi:hypothetical protein